MYKNVANQKIAIYAHDTDADAPKTGDAGNITAYISKDGGGVAQSNDVNPTELDATNAKGIYIFNLTQAETNCDLFVLAAASATSNIQIEPVMAYTETSPVTALSDYDPPTKAEMDAGFSGLNDLSAAEVNAEVDTALGDYDGPTKTEMDDSFAALNDLSAAEVNAEVDSALTDYGGPTKAEMDARIDAVDSAIAALNDISAAVVEQAAQDGAQAAIDAAGLLTAEVLEGLASYRQLRAFARGKVVIDATAGTWTFYDADDATVLYTLAVTAAGRTVS